MRKLLAVIGILLVLSCNKKHNDITPTSFLNFSQTAVSVTPVTGTTTEVIVTSNIHWKLSFSAGTDWLTADKMSGDGNDTIHLIVLTDNVDSLSRKAILTASPTDTTTKVSAQLTIEQQSYNVRLLSQKLYGGIEYDEFLGIQPISSGGFILGGSTRSNQTGLVGQNHSSKDYDAWVVRLNSNQDTLWTRLMGGTGSDFFNGCVAASDGGFVFSGYTNAANGDVVGTFKGNFDWWIVKLNSDGDTVWTRLMGGAFNDIPGKIAATADGGFIVTGYISTGNSSTSRDGWVVKLNSNGDIVWQQILGGSALDMMSDIAITADGSILLAGYSTSTTPGTNHGGGDLWVVKLTADGAVLYSKLFGGTGDDRANAIKATTDGGCIVAGYTSSNKTGDVGSSKGGDDIWVIKLNASGDTTFTALLGGSGSDRANDVILTADGGYIVAGFSNSTDGDVKNNNGNVDAWLMKLSKNGQLLWSKSFGGSAYDIVDKLLLGNNNSIYVLGYTESANTGDIGSTFGAGDAWLFNIKDF
jgi:uncharacterized delta-60 repeat protein